MRSLALRHHRPIDRDPRRPKRRRVVAWALVSAAAAVYRGAQIVGAWIVAGVPWTWSVFGLDQRAEAIAR